MSKRVQAAVVLAAGSGTRFWPYGVVRNKVAFPICNVPVVRRLVERLLILARADVEGVALHRQSVDASSLLAELVQQMRPLADAKGLSLAAQIAPDLSLVADPDAP